VVVALKMALEPLIHKNDVELNVLQEYFLTIAMAKYLLDMKL
jgi:hypothetical protein